MRNMNLLRQSLPLLFARLMAEEGKWIYITRTKARNQAGQQWLMDELLKMARIADIQITYQTEPEYRIMHGTHPDYIPFSMRNGMTPIPKVLRISYMTRDTNRLHGLKPSKIYFDDISGEKTIKRTLFHDPITIKP